MINANKYGFLPENNPYKNSEAFQKAVDNKGCVQVTAPGVYEISEQIEIGDNTKLVFCDGVILRRKASVSGINGNAFINKGALKGEYNRKVVMDIEPTLWQEGTGVNNLIIRNNTFEKCNYSDWGSVIEIGTNIAGRSAETAVFTNIEISSNKFTDIPSMLLRADNINGFVFGNNTIDTGEFFEKNSTQGRIQFGKYCSNITYTDNVFINSGFLRFKEIAKADNIYVWAQINSQL